MPQNPLQKSVNIIHVEILFRDFAGIFFRFFQVASHGILLASSHETPAEIRPTELLQRSYLGVLSGYFFWGVCWEFYQKVPYRDLAKRAPIKILHRNLVITSLIETLRRDVTQRYWCREISSRDRVKKFLQGSIALRDRLLKPSTNTLHKDRPPRDLIKRSCQEISFKYLYRVLAQDQGNYQKRSALLNRLVSTPPPTNLRTRVRPLPR